VAAVGGARDGAARGAGGANSGTAVALPRVRERGDGAAVLPVAGGNCAYWHGVFGGLYLPHLRTAVYNELLNAEALCARHLTVKPAWKNFDFDSDGRDEVLYESPQQNCYFAPHRGGALFEWDLLDKGLNLQNVLTRRQESYHRRLREYLSHPPQADHGAVSIHDMVKVKEQNLDQYLHYDWYRRSSLLDHFFHPATKYDDVRRTQYGEQGDFVLGEYQSELKGKQLTLRREGTIWVNEKPFGIVVTKQVTPQPDGMTVTYTIENRSEATVELFFAPEFNFAFSFLTGGDAGEHSALIEWVRRDEHFGITMRMQFSSPHDLWAFPVETVSLSEGGFERTYQGTVVLPLNRISIPGGGKQVEKIVLRRENR
jgi:alpha-amylase